MPIDTRFLDELASSAPTPGGGGASAYAGALAAALSSMVCNLTTGKKRYADIEEEVQAAMVRLESIRGRLVELIDADADAFEPLAACYRMPKETPEEQAARDAAMQKALVGAIEAPMEIMRQTMAVLDECEWVARNGSRMAVSDAGASAELAGAAVVAASLNVFINAKSLADADMAEKLAFEARRMNADARAKARAISDYVLEQIG